MKTVSLPTPAVTATLPPDPPAAHSASGADFSGSAEFSQFFQEATALQQDNDSADSNPENGAEPSIDDNTVEQPLNSIIASVLPAILSAAPPKSHTAEAAPSAAPQGEPIPTANPGQTVAVNAAPEAPVAADGKNGPEAISSTSSAPTSSERTPAASTQAATSAESALAPSSPIPAAHVQTSSQPTGTVAPGTISDGSPAGSNLTEQTTSESTPSVGSPAVEVETGETGQVRVVPARAQGSREPSVAIRPTRDPSVSSTPVASASPVAQNTSTPPAFVAYTPAQATIALQNHSPSSPTPTQVSPSSAETQGASNQTNTATATAAAPKSSDNPTAAGVSAKSAPATPAGQELPAEGTRRNSSASDAPRTPAESLAQALRRTAPPVAESHGTSSAKYQPRMQNSEPLNEFTGSTMQNMPGRSSTAAPLVATAIAERGVHPRTETERDPILVGATTPSLTATRSETASAVSIQPTISGRVLDRAEDLMALHGLRLRDSGRESLQVTIKPDSNLHLALNIQFRDGAIEVNAQLQRGDHELLSRHWGDLQQQLEGRGIRLNSLNATDSQPAGQQGSAFSQQSRQHRERDEHTTRTGAIAEFALQSVLAPRKPAAKLIIPRGFESWA